MALHDVRGKMHALAVAVFTHKQDDDNHLKGKCVYPGVLYLVVYLMTLY
jgi:hypothetical protein